MSGPAALPIFGDAYLADTQHLTLEEHGAYFKLLLCAWRSTPARLPADDKRIATMLGISAGKWGKLKPAVMAFWTLTESGWEQKRLSKERAYVERKRAEQSARGSAKWTAPDHDASPRANAQKRSQRLSEAREKGRHTDAQWQAIVEACGHKCAKCGAPGEVVKDHILPIYRGGSDGPENLQPLCVSCNSSKSSDATDYRLSVCNDLFERMPECHPKRQPLTPTHLEKKDESVRTLSGECEAVVAEWNAQAKAAGMPIVTTLSTSRKAKLKARLAEHDRAKFTEAIGKLCASTFARNGTWATFDFLLTPNGFVKTIEGNYDDRPNTGTNLQPRNGAGQHTDRLAAGLRLLDEFTGSPPAAASGYR